MTEQRQVRRHPESVLRVTFEHPAGGARVTAPAWDASLGGLFLETDAPPEEGALLTLEIATVDATVSVDARVLWARPAKLADDQPAGMAVRFIDLPDDVSVALGRALQGGMREKTILGVGGLSKEPTQIGIAAAPPPVAPVPRETQIGVAPPANVAVTPEPSITTKEPATTEQAKPRLVVSETSLPLTPVAPKAADPSRLEETAPSRARIEAAKTSPRRPSVAGRVFFLLLLGGAAGAVYVFRDQIVERLVPSAPAPVASSAPASSAPEATSVADSASAAMPTAAADAADTTAVVDAAATHPLDAGARDAGHGDAGVRDAGARDAGGRDGGAGKSAPPRGSVKHPQAP
jgi:hypothetical protein